jgi:NADH-quinone oxidoreductase subunit J|tara:strand:+ start:286 stop:786 length:501 start_codon:yes stop_codon:yes gene_type:complete
MVIISKNPIHSVLFLILCFFNAAVIFLFLEAEFLAMILLIIYVGAVAVLFLFVVMMLDIDIVLLRKNFLNYLPTGLFVGFLIFLELFLVIKKSTFINELSGRNLEENKELLTNTHALGEILYTDYFILFQLSGIILLIAMVGAILLTLRKREGVKRQNIYNQIFRK